MKKANLILALLLCGMLAACSSTETTTTEATTTEATTTETTTTTTDAAEATTEADATEEESTEVVELVMATNAEFPPYEYYENDQVVGIDAEIAAAIADKLGMELRIEDVDFDSVVIGVQSGKYDIGMAGLTVTEERAMVVDFTTSYATGVQSIIVPEGSAITCADDLFLEGSSNKIGVQLATTGDLYSTWDLEDAGLATVERYNKGADAVMALTSGKVDCVIIDNEPAKAFVAANEGLVILDTEYAIEEYAIAVNQDDTELLAAVDAALVELIADGTVEEIINKYISAE